MFSTSTLPLRALSTTEESSPFVHVYDAENDVVVIVLLRRALTGTLPRVTSAMSLTNTGVPLWAVMTMLP